VHDRRDRVDTIAHKAYKIDVKRKKELVAKIIKTDKYDQILLFVNKKDSADAAYAYFKEEGINVAMIHGDVEYKNRVQAIKDFRSKKAKVLIATDIAARGLDIQNLPLVINYSLPETTDDFTHRVGRTGRAGKKGTVITMLTVEEYNQFTKVERHLKLNVKREIDEDFPLKDRQPRQRIMKKKSLSEKKGYKKKTYGRSKDADKAQSGAKSKKTTKRDANRSFRK
jgi:ATP-dependent RNA helicase RhlE